MRSGSPLISDCRFIDNEAAYGGALYANCQSDIEISCCEFSSNYGYEGGGAIFAIVNTIISLCNCTITNNRSPNGGGIEVRTGELTVLNSIISFSSQGEAVAAVDTPDIYIYYSDIYGNSGGDWTAYIADYLGSFGNISSDPLFTNLFEGDYRLQPGSPCIDAGDPQSPDDPDGSRADMGAYYFNHLTGINDDSIIPSIFRLKQNYPNPFNASTTISFELAEPGNVKMAVYDLLGKEIVVLLDSYHEAGRYMIDFDASRHSSGVYFYRLQAGDAVETRRMVLLK